MIPRTDTDYSEWMDRYNAYLNNHFERLGLTVEQTNALDIQHLQWDTDYAANTAAHVTSKATTRTKNNTRKALDDLVRGYNKIIQACPGTTDADREQIGLSVPGMGTSSSMPLEDKPVPEIDVNEALTHEIKVYTHTENGMIGRKPVGAVGCEVYRTIGTAPASVDEMELVGMQLKTSFRYVYPGSLTGKQAYYAMRWITRDGTPGTWSKITSATIAA